MLGVSRRRLSIRYCLPDSSFLLSCSPETSSRVTLAALGIGFQPKLPTIYNRQPTTYNQQPTTNNLQPNTTNQTPPTKHHQPIILYFYLLIFYPSTRQPNKRTRNYLKINTLQKHSFYLMKAMLLRGNIYAIAR